ncbi:MAG: hypothetical protein AB8B62_06550 [Roseobacter sp.]
MTYDRYHGTQIEYHNRNGVSHLWYPGNASGVPARWRVKVYDAGGHAICWRYPNSSYNPVTNLQGGSEECTTDTFYFPSVVQILDGDHFKLDTGKVPFRLPKGQFAAEELALRAGLPKPRTIYESQ